MPDLKFNLDVVDNWPPVNTEVVPCIKVGSNYQIDASPLFIKGLSKGDLVKVEDSEVSEIIFNWEVVKESGNSTIWLLRLKGSPDIKSKLEYLRFIGCDTASLPQYGSYSITVPSKCFIELVDDCLDELNEDEVAVAYPVFRHE
ncbi:hypothetical protein AltI4_12600 [Alteromonas sp. I4]|nr:hypothetical protein AltI4_12600 [Alteromonas sp. I4]